MLEATLNRLAISFPNLFSVSATNKTPRSGPLPTWINDRQLSEQLMKDTGLAPEDLGVSPAYDETKPFFMQRNYW